MTTVHAVDIQAPRDIKHTSGSKLSVTDGVCQKTYSVIPKTCKVNHWLAPLKVNQFYNSMTNFTSTTPQTLTTTSTVQLVPQPLPFIMVLVSKCIVCLLYIMLSESSM